MCGDGSKNVFGIAPNAKIMPIKAIGSDGILNNGAIIISTSDSHPCGSKKKVILFWYRINKNEASTW